MSAQRFDSVWDAIEDTPVEAENMKLRSVLMMALKTHIEQAKLSQAKAAKLFGVTQPRVSDLIRGKIGLFGLDALVNMASAADMHVEMRISGESEKRPAAKKATASGRRVPAAKKAIPQAPRTTAAKKTPVRRNKVIRGILAAHGR